MDEAAADASHEREGERGFARPRFSDESAVFSGQNLYRQIVDNAFTPESCNRKARYLDNRVRSVRHRLLLFPIRSSRRLPDMVMQAIAIVGASAAHGFRLMPVTPVCIMVPQSEPVPRGSNPRKAAVATR